jgi:hypothetical protein
MSKEKYAEFLVARQSTPVLPEITGEQGTIAG